MHYAIALQSIASVIGACSVGAALMMLGATCYYAITDSRAYKRRQIDRAYNALRAATDELIMSRAKDNATYYGACEAYNVASEAYHKALRA
jgi:hypothetical protein